MTILTILAQCGWCAKNTPEAPTCENCGGTGLTPRGTIDIDELMDKCNDILDKCNDIKEKVDEL